MTKVEHTSLKKSQKMDRSKKVLALFPRKLVNRKEGLFFSSKEEHATKPTYLVPKRSFELRSKAVVQRLEGGSNLGGISKKSNYHWFFLSLRQICT